MERKWGVLALALGVVLLAAVIVLGAALGQPVGPADSGGKGLIVISEVMAGNETYLDLQGRLMDYVEIQNTGEIPMDISGYKLSDDPTELGYTFPQGTVLQPGEYLVCPCEPALEERFSTDFRISRDGETSRLL